MILAGRPAKILLIDTNVYFSKRVSDALKKEGFEVICSTQPSFALTTIEYDPPTAIICSTNMREMGALDIARLIRADAKNAALPIFEHFLLSRQCYDQLQCQFSYITYRTY